MQVLSANSLIGRAEPTHVVVQRQPWYADDDRQRTEPAGYFEAGSVVAVIYVDGRFSRVVDPNGRIVHTEKVGLRRITPPTGPPS